MEGPDDKSGGVLEEITAYFESAPLLEHAKIKHDLTM